METEPRPKPPESPLLYWWMGAAAGLFLLLVIPKRGGGEGAAFALGFLEIIVLISLSLWSLLPRIKRSSLGWVVQVFLAVAALTLAVVGSVLLVIFACVGSGGL